VHHRAPAATRAHRPQHRARRSLAGPAWAGLSAVLAAVGVGALFWAPADAPAPARLDVAVPAPVADDAGTREQVRPLRESDPAQLEIPALGVTSQVMHLGLERDGSMQVPPAAYPAGWYDGGPTPGELGPAVLAGHVDWDGDQGVFYGLRELLPGDQVIVDRADGSVATFAVDRVEEHGKDDFPTDDVYGVVPYAGLRLITCGGTFDEQTGDYEDNVIVFATLVATDGPGSGSPKWQR
jgi:sortase (surface protein transpeptidase)